ncbi:bromodomain associated domain-containing protein [Phlyctema vagabunda]|uniref:Bromodomain associated domain-containing protein n=1 Tax=Phlyctema vagabunda TaxID=108571 RepID=A0ABR4P2I5_9HELO
MATPQALHHSLLRPCVLHILRAAGYHSTRPSVLDTLTDLAARYMYLLAQQTVSHATINHTELDISIQDVRMAMQDCGTLVPEKTLEEQDFEGEEDTRGVDAFIAWATGPGNREIRRIALEGGDGAKEDYLTVLKKKHAATDEDSRYNGTILGKPVEPRSIKVEGGEITSVKEWADKRKMASQSTALSSRRPSSALSSLDDEAMDDIDFA